MTTWRRPGPASSTAPQQLPFEIGGVEEDDRSIEAKQKEARQTLTGLVPGERMESGKALDLAQDFYGGRDINLMKRNSASATANRMASTAPTATTPRSGKHERRASLRSIR